MSLNFSRPLRVVIKESVEPLMYPCFFENGFDLKNCPKPGIYVDILRLILEATNFFDLNQIEFFFVKSTKEMYEKLNNSLVDVSANPKEPDFDTFSYLSFSKPILYKERAYILRSIASNTFNESFKILQPFSAEVWGAIL